MRLDDVKWVALVCTVWGLVLAAAMIWIPKDLWELL